MTDTDHGAALLEANATVREVVCSGAVGALGVGQALRAIDAVRWSANKLIADLAIERARAEKAEAELARMKTLVRRVVDGADVRDLLSCAALADEPGEPTP